MIHKAENNILKGYSLVVLIILSGLLTACGNKSTSDGERPLDPWVFRSVLDKKPRMLTVALDSSCYVAYDLTTCKLYKAWKGGVTMEGAAYTDKKNVQPTTWGTDYTSENLQQGQWIAKVNGTEKPSRIIHRGYYFKNNQIHLKYGLILPSKDTVHIEERPEYTVGEGGEPGLERLFTTSGMPQGTDILLKFKNSTFQLRPNEDTELVTFFEKLPPQFPPQPEEAFDHMGRYWMEKSDCFTCHEIEENTVGPSFRQIATKYKNDKDVVQHLVKKVKSGGTGVWGNAMMNPHPNLDDREVKTMLSYILSLQPEESTEEDVKLEVKTVSNKAGQDEINNPVVEKKPGFGYALEGVHPSYDINNLHNMNFQPRVGGLAFLPDGRLLVTTWDAVGGVYLLDGVETGDSSKVSIKRIASGLSEPLGIEVVDGEIYVLQKHELTQLVDLDGDEIIDEYRVICNSWGVSNDFHEFAFGLVYKEGYFYATLSLAMRLMADEQQKFDRGRTIKISRDGSYEWLNFGLRTPNGIGLNQDDELFITDNQGQWVPANKLIHVKKGEYHGMAWGLPKSMPDTPKIAMPAIWLPQDEIGNSPTEPVVMQDGPYKGQLLHGDVTHGGIKRDFLEKINGEYQGAVFRFSQGFEAGVNRLCWGPDGALYVGGVGMVGGWSWKGKQFGLQRMKYNGKVTFEMLAVRVKPRGFEIEFTEALENEREYDAFDFFLQQWRYHATSNYGGPKLDLEELKVKRLEISEDRKKVYLEVPDLKEEHVVYFRLAEDTKSVTGQPLWSSEAWYTLNNIPE
jgi:cytochrome c